MRSRPGMACPLALALALAIAGVAASSGCASTAREASRGGAEGALEGLRADPTVARLYEDVGRDPTLGGVGRRFTDGVVTAVAVALVPALEAATDRVAERVALAVRRHAAAADPLAAIERMVRALARDAEARAATLLAEALERARAAPVRRSLLEGAEDLGAALARGAMREVTASVSAEVARGLDLALARAASVTVSAETLDRIHEEIERISMHMSRGTYKEIQNQVRSDDTWKWGLAIGGAALAAILILRAYREIGRLKVLSDAAVAKATEAEREAERALDAARSRSGAEGPARGPGAQGGRGGEGGA